MRGFDYSPLLRTTVGFDRLARTLDSLANEPSTPSYPPYNIEKLGEDDYTITLAVAGFGEDDLDVTVKERTLTVSGRIAAADDDPRVFLHRGIAERAFERRFSLADHIEVTDAALQNGLLVVKLTRNVPEEAKPRTISIGKSAKGRKAIEKKAA